MVIIIIDDLLLDIHLNLPSCAKHMEGDLVSWLIETDSLFVLNKS